MLKGDTSKSAPPTAPVTQQQTASTNGSSTPKPTQNNSADKKTNQTAPPVQPVQTAPIPQSTPPQSQPPQITSQRNDSSLSAKLAPQHRPFEQQIVSAGNRFLEFHRHISNHRFNAAYDCYTRTGQQDRGARENFSNGYADTLTSEVTSLQVISADNYQVDFKYQLKARDRDGNRVKVQFFEGVVTMAKENGVWGIESAESRKTGEKYE